METTPVWQPDENQFTQFDRFEMFLKENNGLQFANYTELHEWSVQQSAQFWEALSQFFNLKWHENAYQIMSPAEEPWQVEWFLGGKLNYAEHLLRRDDAHPALISYDEHGHRETLSFHQPASYTHLTLPKILLV